VNRAGTAQIDSLALKFLSLGMHPDVTSALDEIYRSDWGRIVAALIRLFGDFDAAKEAAREAFPRRVSCLRGWMPC
jgi:hypothetical protein